MLVFTILLLPGFVRLSLLVVLLLFLPIFRVLSILRMLSVLGTVLFLSILGFSAFSGFGALVFLARMEVIQTFHRGQRSFLNLDDSLGSIFRVLLLLTMYLQILALILLLSLLSILGLASFSGFRALFLTRVAVIVMIEGGEGSNLDDVLRGILSFPLVVFEGPRVHQVGIGDPIRG
jgi:hypothetical protein